MVSKTILIVLLAFAFVHVTNGHHSKVEQRNVYKSFIVDYLKERRIQAAIMFLCWPLEERIELLKKLSANNILASLPSGKHKKNRRELDELYRLQSTIVGIIFDSCCYDTRAPNFQKYTYFNGSYIWLILDCSHFYRSLDYLKLLPLLITTDLVLIDTAKDSKSIDLYDIYHTGFTRGGEFNYTFVGTWYHNCRECRETWKRFFGKSKAVRRYNLNGLIIRTTVLTENNINNIDTHTYLVDDRQPYTDSLFKMNYQLILLLKKMYNFTVTFVMANNWSDKNSKGLYQSGNLLGILVDKKADIMAAGLQYSADRVEVADPLYLTYPFRTGFVFRYQGDFGEVKSSFLAPFNKAVWYCYVIMILMVILVIWCILLFENKFLTNINKTLWNFSDTILSVIGACCQMGSEVNPVTSASRLVYFIFFFTCLVIYNFYTSSIVSSLLNYRSESLSLLQLADSPLQCGALDVGYAHYLLFDATDDETLVYFTTQKKTDHFFIPVEDGIQNVKRGGFAYHSEYNAIYELIEKLFEAREICELQEIDTIPMTKMGMFGMKNSPYSEMFRLGLNKAHETGHLNKFQLKWIARKPTCQISKTFIEVSLHQVTPSHIILYMGIAFSIAIFIFERKKWQDYFIRKDKKVTLQARKYAINK